MFLGKNDVVACLRIPLFLPIAVVESQQLSENHIQETSQPRPWSL